MKNIILHWLLMPQKMLLHLLHPPLHLQVPLPRYRLEYPLQVRYILLENEHRKRLPIQCLEERGYEVIRDDHGHALVEYGLHHPGAVHLKPSCADAVLAALHVLHVARLPPRLLAYLPEYLHVGVLALPLLKQDRPEVAVHVAREEGEIPPLGRGPAPELP